MANTLSLCHFVNASSPQQRFNSLMADIGEGQVNLIAVFCILSWRIFWMTMMNRSTSNAPTSIAFTDDERQLLDRLIPDKKKTPSRPKNLSAYITKVARLGDYLARASDPPPGNTVMWRGLVRLTDIAIGFDLAKNVGN